MGSFPEKLEDLVRITQDYQHKFYKKHIEALRRKKYRNVNGLLQFHFVNTWPAIDWSIIDYYRKPKKAYFTVKDAFKPVLVSFTAIFNQGSVEARAWVVNDYHHSLEDLTLRWEITGKEEHINKEVEIPVIEADLAGIIAREIISGDFKEIRVRGELIDKSGKVLSANKDTLIPLKKYKYVERVDGVKVNRKADAI